MHTRLQSVENACCRIAGVWPSRRSPGKYRPEIWSSWWVCAWDWSGLVRRYRLTDQTHHQLHCLLHRLLRCLSFGLRQGCNPHGQCLLNFVTRMRVLWGNLREAWTWAYEPLVAAQIYDSLAFVAWSARFYWILLQPCLSCHWSPSYQMSDWKWSIL